MNPLPWVGLVAAGLLAGASLSGLLVVRRTYEMLMVASGGAAVAATSIAVWFIASTQQRTLVLFVALLVSLGSVAGGFGLISSLLDRTRRRDQPPPQVPQSQPSATAVIMLADVEHPTYCPGDITAEIADLVAAGIPESGIGSTPFIYAAQKARYRAIGDRSPEYEQARLICDRVGAMLERERFGVCQLVRCSDGNALASVVSSAIEAGHRSIVVATTHVAESFRVDREKGGVDALEFDRDTVSLEYTQPLWASSALADLTASRILAVAPEPERTGVALVMHGQPGERERTHSTFDVQENAFANRVRLLLADAGIPGEYIRTCWQDWHEPDVTETVRHIAALGCSRIVISPTCFPFENLATLLDLPVAIRQARVGDAVNVVQVAPWRDDEVFAEEISSAVRIVTDGGAARR